MKRLLHISKLVLCLLYCQFAIAQEVATGRVTDDKGNALPGVNVSQEKTTTGVLTNAAGSFSLTLVPGAPKILVISNVGFQSQTIPYTGAKVSVALRATTADLEDVVVVGYSSQRKTTVSGAISTVDMNDVETRRVPGVAQALQGQVAGVQIAQSTGAPGDPINFRIRGEGTIGNNNPLFVIDGIPSRDITFLAPADIQSITVLKDASAAAIYGSRAAAGVVVITTKAGRKGRSAIDVNYFNGIQHAANLPKLLNADQYIGKMEEAWNNSGNTGTNPYTLAKSKYQFANTNWLDELFEMGHSQNLQLTASGGSDKVQFLLSGSAYQQDGIVIYDNDKYQRLNLRANINANMNDRLRIGTNLQLSYSVQDALSSRGDAPGIIRHALIRPPIIPVYKDPSDPTYNPADPFTDLPFFTQPWTNADNIFEFTSNPVALAYYSNDKRSLYRTFGNAYAEYAFLTNKALRFRTNIGIDLIMSHNKAFNQNFGDDNGGQAPIDAGAGRQNRPTSLNENRGQDNTWTWNNTLNYSNTFGRHNISALVGTEYIRNYSSSIGASRQRFDFTSPEFQYIDYGGTSQDLYNGGSGAEWALFSLFGSATYMYHNKYTITGTIRADASSRFAQNNQWGYFPSVAANWRIGQEAFLKDVAWLSELKVRGSIGKLGNQEIDNYSYLTLLRRSGDLYLTSRYGNPDLKWETTTQKDLGIDMSLYKNRVFLSLDYYSKTTSGILLPISLPALVGNVSPTFINAGEVNNRGVELALSIRNSGKVFRYNIDGNIGTVVNKVVKMHPNYPYITGDVYRTQAGHPLSSFYGYVMDGIYQNEAEITAHQHGTANPSAKPGDIRFKDLNNDGIINDDDRTFLGNSIPKLTYGLNLSGGYKKFDLSVLFQGVGGVYRYNDAKQITDYDSRPFNHSVAVLNAWHGEGTSNTIPRTTFNDNGNSKKSSIFVENAAYLRLKNVELGYTLPRFMKTGVQSIRLYVSAQNIFTITKYSGLDPESTDLKDQGTYPQSQALLFGVNASF